MPKITNWTRREDRETPDRPFVWENEKTGNLVSIDFEEVLDDRDPDFYLVRVWESGSEMADESEMITDFSLQFTIDEATESEAKEGARKKAVEWMRRHPYAGRDDLDNVEISVEDLSAKVVDCEPKDYDFGSGYPSDWDVAFRQTEEERMNERWMPMMNTLWCLPDDYEVSEEDKQAMDNMTVVRIKSERDYGGNLYLALTGGGMDMSWQIARTYVNLGLLPPASLGTLPNMANIDPSKPDNRRIVEALKKSHEINKGSSEHAISELDRMVE